MIVMMVVRQALSPRRTVSATLILDRPAVAGQSPGEVKLRHHKGELHAADRAGAGALLLDFRMHRAGIERPFDDRRLLSRSGEITLRIADKLVAASTGAEVVGLAVMGSRIPNIPISTPRARTSRSCAPRGTRPGVTLR